MMDKIKALDLVPQASVASLQGRITEQNIHIMRLTRALKDSIKNQNEMKVSHGQTLQALQNLGNQVASISTTPQVVAGNAPPVALAGAAAGAAAAAADENNMGNGNEGTIEDDENVAGNLPAAPLSITITTPSTSASKATNHRCSPGGSCPQCSGYAATFTTAATTWGSPQNVAGEHHRMGEGAADPILVSQPA
jgi:hypothetical protein